MDAKTAAEAHPAFVEILRQITPDEARLLQYVATNRQLPLITIREKLVGTLGHRREWPHLSLFDEKAQLEHSALSQSYVQNLARLGLLELPESQYLDDAVYAELEEHPNIKKFRADVDAQEGVTSEVLRRMARVTEFGDLFIQACVLDRTETRGGASELDNEPNLPE